MNNDNLPRERNDPSPAQRLQPGLLTPIYLKTHDGTEFPDNHRVYLVLAGNGLWLCRNHEFFSSSVPARSWPSELAPHQAELVLRHPQIPRSLLEKVVGFFDIVALRFGSEAGVLLAWHRQQRRMTVVVPRQLATVSVTSGGNVFPIGLHYEIPQRLNPDLTIIGDVHSHVYDSAYSSGQDRDDERYRGGLHLVVGRLSREPPQLHAEYVVDGTRFSVDPSHVLEGYRRRRYRISRRWIRQVRLKVYGANNVYHDPRGAEDERPHPNFGPPSPGDEA